MLETVSGAPDKPEMQFDVTQTKEVIVAVVGLANATKKSLDDDGKITITDIGNFVGVTPSLVKAISEIHFVPSELNDLQDDEILELISVVKDELEWADDAVVKTLIDQGLKIVLAVKQIIEVL